MKSRMLVAVLIVGPAVLGSWWALGCGAATPEAQAPSHSAPPGQYEPEAERSQSEESLHTETGAAAPAPAAPSPAAPSPAAPSPAAPPPAQSPAAGSQPIERPAPEAGQGQHDAAPKRKVDAEKARGALAFNDAASAFYALEQQEQYLQNALQLAAHDCSAAETFRKAVCELAERICTLEAQVPDTTQRSHCGDARARCSAASQRFRSHCD